MTYALLHHPRHVPLSTAELLHLAPIPLVDAMVLQYIPGPVEHHILL
jgi:hypothetical protein